MKILTEVGAYEQPDLEKMSTDELEQVRDFAGDRFNACFESHGDDYDAAESCRDCEYFELLAGAADDLLLDEGRN